MSKQEAKDVEQEAIGQEGAEFLEQFAGEGTAEITQAAVATPWLSIMQDRTQHVIDGLCDAGVWRNSATGEVLGKTIRVIPIAFKVIWNERDAGTGKTVQNHEPGSIQLKAIPIKGKNFPKMINPETGNKVDETFLYAVVLADAPEMGFCLIQASMGSLGTFKRWNALLRAQILPNGSKAPLFAYVWELSIGDDQARNSSGQLFYKLDDFKRAEMVTKDLFMKGVAPNRQLALTAQMALSAPTDNDTSLSEQIEE